MGDDYILTYALINLRENLSDGFWESLIFNSLIFFAIILAPYYTLHIIDLTISGTEKTKKRLSLVNSFVLRLGAIGIPICIIGNIFDVKDMIWFPSPFIIYFIAYQLALAIEEEKSKINNNY